MSPSSATSRPVWVWSLPFVAVIVSYLLYRKKRGILETDTGGITGDTSELCTSQTESDKVSAQIEVSQKNEISEIKKVLEIEETVVVEEEEAAVVSIEQDSKVIEKEDDIETITIEEEAEVITKEDEIEVITIEEEAQVIEKEDDIEVIIIEETEVITIKEGVEEKGAEIVSKESKKPELVDEVIGKVTSSKANTSRPNSSKFNNSRVNTCPTLAEKIDWSALVEEKTKKSEKKKSKCRKKGMAKKTKDMQSTTSEDNAANMLEQKLAKLDLANNNDDKKPSDERTERDSANNSPSEIMLASPSISGYSDTHSEGSSDSGKGCSEVLTPSRTPASGNSVSGDLAVITVYEFVIPQHLVGRLIGRHGSYIQEVKGATGSTVFIKDHPESNKIKICAIEGTQMDIESALEMIRKKFPKKRYPAMTLEQVFIQEPAHTPVLPENMQLYLVEGINNDVILSSLVTAGHLFVQQPTHPTYLSLHKLVSCMTLCYSEPNQPLLPPDVTGGVLCAAPAHNGWYRAQITAIDHDSDLCDVKFVDYGGYLSLPISSLRQIRSDFVNLPFQAAECILAGIRPIGNECDVWSEEAKQFVEALTLSKMLQAQIYGYAEDGTPFIHLYVLDGNQVRFINQELVDNGFADWLYVEEVTEVEVMSTAGVGETIVA